MLLKPNSAGSVWEQWISSAMQTDCKQIWGNKQTRILKSNDHYFLASWFLPLREIFWSCSWTVFELFTIGYSKEIILLIIIYHQNYRNSQNMRFPWNCCCPLGYTVYLINVNQKSNTHSYLGIVFCLAPFWYGISNIFCANPVKKT